MADENRLFKHEESDVIWWVDTSESDGKFVFTFDKKTYFNMFRDYPHKLTAEQKRIFDNENPFWAEFFRGR